MSLILPSRRAFLGLLAAPAVVRVDSLMRLPVRPPRRFLTLGEITREALRIYQDTNNFLHALEERRIPTVMTVRLPA